MIIETRVPTRIDLAGGTLDLYPLYLFHEGAITVNFAIDQYAHCRLETRSDGRFRLEAKDRGAIGEFDSLAAMKDDTTVELLSRLVYFFRPETGIDMVTEATAPAGAGLGGSSALNVAVCGALNQLTGNRYNDRDLLAITQNVETQVIKVPAGCQDYYPPMYGGTIAIHLTPHGTTAEQLQIDPVELESRLVLCYTGAPRHSGINNWEIFKRHIDGNAQVVELIGKISETAQRMRQALVEGDYDKIGPLLDEEWQSRRQLAPGVSTSFIDELTVIAKGHGATAVKVCGAGGGGCIVFAVAKGRKAEVEAALRARNASVIDFHIARAGLVNGPG